MPGAPSSILAPSSDARSPSNIVAMPGAPSSVLAPSSETKQVLGPSEIESDVLLTPTEKLPLAPVLRLSGRRCKDRLKLKGSLDSPGPQSLSTAATA